MLGKGDVAGFVDDEDVTSFGGRSAVVIIVGDSRLNGELFAIWALHDAHSVWYYRVMNEARIGERRRRRHDKGGDVRARHLEK